MSEHHHQPASTSAGDRSGSPSRGGAVSAADRLTDEGDTRDAIYQALHEVLACDPMWIGDDGEPLDYLHEREVLIGDAVERQTDAVERVLAARGVRAPGDTTADRDALVRIITDEPLYGFQPGAFGCVHVLDTNAGRIADAILATRPEGGA
ncbi:hypothetical protein [Nocardioides zeae]